MIRKYRLKVYTIIVVLISVFSSCSDSEMDLPSVTTVGISSLAYNEATVIGSTIQGAENELIEQGICWSINPNPTIADFFDKALDNNTGEFSIILKNLDSNTKYYIKAYAKNNEGISYGEELTFTLWLNTPDDNVTDIDNNTYSTSRIGNQTWLINNLKVTRYQNGDNITYITLEADDEWLNTTDGAYCSYNDDLTNTEKYGYLYNGYAIMDERSLCPEGWHVPSKEEWKTLIDYLGGSNVAANFLNSFEGWGNQNPNVHNLSGFTALPGGIRLHALKDSQDTGYWGLLEQAYFACSDEVENIGYVWYANAIGNWIRVSDNGLRTSGQSVRCIKN